MYGHDKRDKSDYENLPLASQLCWQFRLPGFDTEGFVTDAHVTPTDSRSTRKTRQSKVCCGCVSDSQCAGRTVFTRALRVAGIVLLCLLRVSKGQANIAANASRVASPDSGMRQKTPSPTRRATPTTSNETHDAQQVNTIGRPKEARCVESTTPLPPQYFGIDVYKPSQRPNIPTPRHRMCISDGPAIIVLLHGVRFNILNTTLSEENCRHFYTQTVCATPKENIPAVCERATQVVFAMLQQTVECNNDADCRFPRNEYTIPKLSCAWMAQLEQELCSNDAQKRVSCEDNDDKSTRIREACVFTDRYCRFIISQRHIVSPLLGICIFIISVVIVLCTMG